MIFENKKLDTTSTADEMITMIAIQPLRIIYSFMPLRTASSLSFKNIIDEKWLEIFIDSRAIRSTATDEMNIPGKKTSVWKMIPFNP